MLKKGTFSSIYATNQQKYCLFSVINTQLSLLYIGYLLFEQQKKHRTTFKLSRTANSLIIFSQIIYLLQIHQTLPSQQTSQCFFLMLYTTLNFVNFLICMIYQLKKIQSSEGTMIIQSVLVLISLPLIQIHILIIVLILIFETITLVREQQLDPIYRAFIYPHLLIALLFIPLFRLFAKQNYDSQYDKFHQRTNLYLGIYLFVLYELHFWGIGLLVRKYKFLSLQLIQQKIKKIEVEDVCRVCYKSLGESKDLIEGHCLHKYHKACLALQKTYLCPIDKISLKTNKKE